MKRIILMLTVAAFMVAALTVSAAAAFADSGFAGESGKKVGVQSSKPIDGSGAYDPSDHSGHGPNH
jgi:hypothetical protein